jgi:hypothetical protein
MQSTYGSEYIFLNPEPVILTQKVPVYRTVYAKFKYTVRYCKICPSIWYNTHIFLRIYEAINVFLQRFLEYF